MIGAFFRLRVVDVDLVVFVFFFIVFFFFFSFGDHTSCGLDDDDDVDDIDDAIDFLLVWNVLSSDRGRGFRRFCGGDGDGDGDGDGLSFGRTLVRLGGGDRRRTLDVDPPRVRPVRLDLTDVECKRKRERVGRIGISSSSTSSSPIVLVVVVVVLWPLLCSCSFSACDCRSCRCHPSSSIHLNRMDGSLSRIPPSIMTHVRSTNFVSSREDSFSCFINFHNFMIQ